MNIGMSNGTLVGHSALSCVYFSPAVPVLINTRTRAHVHTTTAVVAITAMPPSPPPPLPDQSFLAAPTAAPTAAPITGQSRGGRHDHARAPATNLPRVPLPRMFAGRRVQLLAMALEKEASFLAAAAAAAADEPLAKRMVEDGWSFLDYSSLFLCRQYP